MGRRARLLTRSVADRRSSKSIKQQRSISRVAEAEVVKSLAVLPKEKSQLSSSMVQIRRSRSLWMPYFSSGGGRCRTTKSKKQSERSATNRYLDAQRWEGSVWERDTWRGAVLEYCCVATARCHYFLTSIDGPMRAVVDFNKCSHKVNTVLSDLIPRQFSGLGDPLARTCPTGGHHHSLGTGTFQFRTNLDRTCFCIIRVL